MKINVDVGSSIVIRNGVVTINGKRMKTEIDDKDKIILEGNIESLDTDLNVEVHGNVGGNVTAGGNVSCDNVGDSVKAGGNVSADDVDGDVEAGGNVSCDDVGGSVKAGTNISVS